MKTKKLSVRPSARPNSDINVTPLVDVVLVLLIIFMVVTPLLEKDIEVRVPDKEEQVEETDPQPDQLVVTISEQGEIKINTHPVAEGPEYIDQLKRILQGKKHDERLVFFMPDDKANYGKVVAALDGAKLAGAEILGMVTDPVPPQQGQPGAPGGQVAPAGGTATPATP